MRDEMRAKVVSLALVAVFLASAVAEAQVSTEGSIAGVVRDEQGAVLPGVTITAVDAAGTFQKTVVTGDTGEFRFAIVPTGTYTLTAQLQGFSRLVRPGIHMRAGLNLRVDLTLRIGQMSDAVQVFADTPMIETKTSVQAVHISGQFQRSLPLSARRSWDDFLRLVPGTAQNDNANRPFWVHGADFDSQVIQIDGADMASAQQNANAYLNLSDLMISDVQVKTGGVDAASPMGLGAVISIAAPRGSNRNSMAAAFAYQDLGWNDNNQPGGTPTVSGLRQFDAALSGPIVRNRWWYFASYRFHDSETGINRNPAQLAMLKALVPGFRPFNGKNVAHYYFAKTTVQLSNRHELSGFVKLDHNPRKTAFASSDGIYDLDDTGGVGFSTRLSSTWSERLLTKLGVSYNDNSLEIENFGPSTPSRQVHAGTFLSGGRRTGTGIVARLDQSVQSSFKQSYAKATVSADTSYFLRAGVGEHELQAGVALQPLLHQETEQVFPNRGYFLEEVVLRNPADPSAGFIPFHRRVADRERVQTRLIDSSDSGFYLQDAWRITSVTTLTAGVRADYISREDKLFDVVTQRSWHVAPRLGLNHAWGHGRRSVSRASWGRVFDVTARGSLPAGSSSAGFTDTYDLNLDGTFETSFFTPGTTATTLNRKFDAGRRQPRYDELTVGHQQQLPGTVVVDAGYVHRDYRRRTAFIEINGIYDNGRFLGYRDESQNDIFLITENTYNHPVYNAFTLQLSKSSTRVQVLANYTRQWRHMAGTWQPTDPAGILQPHAFPNDGGIGGTSGSSADANGYSVIDDPRWQDHVFRAGASLMLPWQLRVSTNYTIQSGTLSGPIITRISSPDPNAGPPTIRLSNGRVVSNPLATTLRFEYPTRGEGQFALPALHIFNLRVGRRFGTSLGNLDAFVDVFNLTNHDADTLTVFGQSNRTFSPDYRKGAGRQAPRAVQVSFRWEFDK